MASNEKKKQELLEYSWGLLVRLISGSGFGHVRNSTHLVKEDYKKIHADLVKMTPSIRLAIKNLSPKLWSKLVALRDQAQRNALIVTEFYPRVTLKKFNEVIQTIKPRLWSASKYQSWLKQLSASAKTQLAKLWTKFRKDLLLLFLKNVKHVAKKPRSSSSSHTSPSLLKEKPPRQNKNKKPMGNKVKTLTAAVRNNKLNKHKQIKIHQRSSEFKPDLPTMMRMDVKEMKQRLQDNMKRSLFRPSTRKEINQFKTHPSLQPQIKTLKDFEFDKSRKKKSFGITDEYFPPMAKKFKRKKLVVCETKNFQVNPKFKMFGQGVYGFTVSCCRKNDLSDCKYVMKIQFLSKYDFVNDSKKAAILRDYLNREMYFTYWLEEYAMHTIAPKLHEHRVCRSNIDTQSDQLALVMDQYEGSFKSDSTVLSSEDVKAMLELILMLRFYLIFHGDVKLDQFLYRFVNGKKQLALTDYGFGSGISSQIMKREGLTYNTTINTETKIPSRWSLKHKTKPFERELGWLSNHFSEADAKKFVNTDEYNSIIPYFDLLSFDMELLDIKVKIKMPGSKQAHYYAGTSWIPDHVWDFVAKTLQPSNKYPKSLKTILAHRNKVLASGIGILF